VTARLRRDSLLAAVGEFVPALSGVAFGIAVRLLSLSARLGGPLVSHLRSRLSTPNDQAPDTFDPLVGQARRSELLVLDADKWGQSGPTMTEVAAADVAVRSGDLDVLVWRGSIRTLAANIRCTTSGWWVMVSASLWRSPR
jgi:hypothetical protein